MDKHQLYKIPYRKWLLQLFHARTFFVLGISQLACLITVYFKISFGTSFALFSLVVAFPLVFSMQAAFKRRDRALEYLSHFRAGIETTFEAFKLAKKLVYEDQLKIRTILEEVCDALISYLKNGEPSIQELYGRIDQVYLFMKQHRKAIGLRLMIKITRFMMDVHQSTAYLVSFTRHRTMVFMRKFSYFFINFFPFIHAPFLYNIMGGSYPVWLIFLGSGLATLVLITFYNVQRQIENPFDGDGLDDIQLDLFKL